MAVKINIGDEQSAEPVKVNVTGQPNQPKVNISAPDVHVEVNQTSIGFDLNARKALNGDIMIFDHSDIDIVILTEKKNFPEEYYDLVWKLKQEKTIETILENATLRKEKVELIKFLRSKKERCCNT